MSIKVVLTAAEARVIGCLIEKQITTPDQYPLSLNALTNACNQKSNRDPVLAMAETEVQQLVDTLVRKHVVMERSGFGSRVPKYQHCYCNTEFSGIKFTREELAIVCELLLRGPQTPGELRTRAARMGSFTDSADVEEAIEALANRAEGAVVQRLPRQPGRREARYAQLLTGEPSAELTAECTGEHGIAPAGTASREPAADGALLHRVGQLENEVATLRSEVDALRSQLQSLI